MPDLVDLYPGYASRWIDTSIGEIFARVGDSGGPPLLLLHGHPQSNVMWHRVAPALAAHFTLVIADLPGYGWSAAPRANAEHAPYTERAMAIAMIQIMEALGFDRFRLAGHDRGGRVGYRLALENPGRIDQLAVLDIVTTWDMWRRMNARLAARAWHWMFLSLPEPFPETLIGHDPKFFFDSRTTAGAKDHAISVFDPRALAHYHAASRIRPASTPCVKIMAPAAPRILPMTRPTARRARRSAALSSRCGARAGCRPVRASTRWPAGAIGRRTCAALPSRAVIICRRRIRPRPHRRCWSSSARGKFAHDRPRHDRPRHERIRNGHLRSAKRLFRHA